MPATRCSCKSARISARAFRNNPDFYLVSDVEDSRPVRFNRAWLAAIIFLAMITAFVSGSRRHHAGRLPGRRRDGRHPLHLGQPTRGSRSTCRS